MKPMGKNSTPSLSYHEISVENTDLYDDAWGFYSEFHDVIDALNMVKVVPEGQLTKRLIHRVRQESIDY
jgi:hypothetical protein